MNNLAVSKDGKENKKDDSKEFLKNLCRDLSLERLKKHSFMNFITQNDAKRKIEKNTEGHWISVIYVKGDNLQFIFKTQFVTEDAKHFAHKAYGEKKECEGLNKKQVDEFIKEFCNLMGGGIKEHFEKADISDTLEITGYIQFTNILKGYLTKNKQSKILIDRIKQELNNEELIQKNITTDKDEIKKLIKIYNSYSSRVWVVDKLFKTNNSNIVTDLINIHISRWISEISDISNNSDESIKRLEV